MWINVAENNDQGEPSGKASCIDFEGLGRLITQNLEGQTFTHVKGKMRFRMNRRHYSYSNYQVWAGSMIYNRYAVPDIEACGLLNDLVATGNWYWEEVASEVADIIDEDGVILLGDFQRISCVV